MPSRHNLIYINKNSALLIFCKSRQKEKRSVSPKNQTDLFSGAIPKRQEFQSEMVMKVTIARPPCNEQVNPKKRTLRKQGE
jgi:hypothetical protein